MQESVGFGSWYADVFGTQRMLESVYVCACVCACVCLWESCVGVRSKLVIVGNHQSGRRIRIELIFTIHITTIVKARLSAIPLHSIGEMLLLYNMKYRAQSSLSLFLSDICMDVTV